MDRIDELIEEYRLDYLEDRDAFVVREDYRAKKDNVLDEIKSLAPEIKERMRENKAEEHRRFEERQAKIASIEGLEEIRIARADVENWRHEFNRSFEGECAVGGMGVRPKPEYDFEAMYAKYPVARDYLKAEAQSEKHNYELAAIGRRALEAIIENPKNHEKAISKMKRELERFTEQHMCD